MYHETTVVPTAPMPRGYSFLPKGIAFKTLHCRKLTREANMPIYVVTDNKRTRGIRAPKAIISQVHQRAKETLSSRRAAVQKRDATDVTKTTKELKAQFPKMPDVERGRVLKHGFKKHSGRVGRTGLLTLQTKVRLAVIAHIRHKHTNYDALLQAGATKEDARVLISKKINGVMRECGYAEARSHHTVSKKNEKGRQKATRQSPRGKRPSKRNSKDDNNSDSDYIP